MRVFDLPPGTSTAATFAVTRESVLLATEQGDLACVPGNYVLSVENGAGEVLTRDLAINGRQAVVVPFPVSMEHGHAPRL